MLAASLPATHPTGLVADLPEHISGGGEEGTHSPMCATRLTIFRAPTPTKKSTTPGSHHVKTPLSPRSPFSSSPLLKFTRGPAQPDTGHGDYFPPTPPLERSSQAGRSGGNNSGASATWHPRTPTHIKTAQEMRGEVQGLTSASGKAYFGENEIETPVSASSHVKAFNIPGATATDARPSSLRNHSPDDSTPHSTPALAPLTLTPLTEDILLPFADREYEVPALLYEPINQPLREALKRVLGARHKWDEFEQKLKEPRSVSGDQIWVDDLEHLVREGDAKIWVSLRGLLGADDIPSSYSPAAPTRRGSSATTDAGAAGVVQANHGMRMTSLEEGETVLRTSALFGPNPVHQSRPEIFTNRPFPGLGNRRMSFESVFFSDSGSEAPASPGVSNYSHYPFPSNPSNRSPDRSPARQFAFLPHSHSSANANTATSPSAHSPSSPRHFRTRSHGGAIASPAFTMAAIQENEPGDDAEPPVEGSFKRSRSSADVHRDRNRGMNPGKMSPLGHRMMGLRIVSLSAADPDDVLETPVATTPRTGKHSPVDSDNQDGYASASSAGGGGYRRRYSFGQVKQQGLGLSTQTGA